MRVISLLPSATEIVHNVGATDLLVGRSHECDHPPEIEPLPALTEQRTHYDPDAGTDARTEARAVDLAVRDHLAEHRSLYRLDTERMLDLRPDLIITQDLCDVCSIDLATVRGAARELAERTGVTPDIISLDPHTIEAVLDDVLRIGEALGRPDAARDAVIALRGRIFAAEEHVNAYAHHPVVGFLEWTNPLFVAGHWTVQLIERAGGRHPLNESSPIPGHGAAEGPQRGQRAAGKSIAVTPEIFAATAPEYLVIAPCGLTLEQTRREAQRLLEHDWFRSLPAVQRSRVALVDGSEMFNRPGPRLVDAFEWLVGWIHDRPGLIPAGFPWEPLKA